MDDFGGRLRQARERRGISLRQIAASTKISAAALDALERNDISKLPGGIFSRAFVRSYAIEVGLNPDDTVREFLDRFNQEPPPAAETSDGAALPEEERAFQERQRQAARVAVAVMAVMVVLVVVAVFAYRARVRARAAVPQTAQDSVPPPVAAAGAASAAGTPAVAADAGRSSAAPATPVENAAPPVPAGQVRLEIHPIAPCWVSVTADGRKLFARIMDVGQKESVTIAKAATVELGDAGAFAYSINGKPGKPLGDKGQVRSFTLTPATAAQFVR
jgi:cytoskeleton protein RodZ